jgi:hypothetical protein
MKPETPCLRKSDWEVRRVSHSTALELVRRLHYSKGGSNTATFVHGLFRRGDDTKCYGVAWWLPPTRSAAEARYDGDFREVLSLSRLAIEPDAPTNAATFLMMAGVRDIAKDGRFKCLLTYADESQGHTGQIYKASNWEPLGPTKPERMYLTADGVMVARKAGPRTRTHGEMLALGHRCVGLFRKQAFRMILSPA